MKKHRIRLLSVITWTVLLVNSSITLSAQSENVLIDQRLLFTGGSGSSEEPYLISEQSHLENIRLFPDAHYLQTEDIRLEGQWQPIPLFNGVYDGNGYSIYNLKINRKDDNAGLFGILTGGALMRINITGGIISGRNYIGSLVGSNEGGKILNCSAQAIVTGNNDVGGIAGSNFGIITGSFSYSAKVSGSGNVGGLVGANYGGEVRNCYSTNEISGNSSLGGLVGLNIVEGLVANCYATGKVTGDTDTGGLTGVNLYADIQNSYWDVESSGQLTSAGGTGKTTLEMLDYNTFTDWTFFEENNEPPVWNNWSTAYANPYVLKTYPYLSWQGEPGEHNYPFGVETHFKEYQNRTTYWESFPRLLAQNRISYTLDTLLVQVLDANNGIHRVIEKDEQYMECNYNVIPPEWVNNPVLFGFNSPSGYKLQFLNNSGQHRIRVEGPRQDPETILTLQPYPAENWSGYFLPETQHPFDALANIIDDVMSIQGEQGALYRLRDGFQWSDIWLSSGLDYFYYGKMYRVSLKDDIYNARTFTWSSTRGDPPKYHFHKPQPQHFSFIDRPDYESFFIEEIDNDENLKEVAVFIDEECVGATVFDGNYPIGIQVYTDPSHAGKEVSFVLHRGTRSEEQDRYKNVQVRDNMSGDYSQKVLKPLEQRYTVLRLIAEDYTETPVQPQVLMGQNFPNPFVTSTTTGSASQHRAESSVGTSIPIYLSKDMDVDISVFNIKGQRVKTITSGNLTAGKHNISWDGRNEQNRPVSAGIYFYRLESQIETINKKLLIIR